MTTQIRTGRVYTVHKVTADIDNAERHQWRDKRHTEDWSTKAVIPAGTRILVSRDYGDPDMPSRNRELGIECCSVTLSKPHRRYDQEIRYYERRAPGDETATVSIDGDDPKDYEDLSRAEIGRMKGRLTLIRLLLANLSEPVRDFDSVIVTAGIRSESVLERLYLAGEVSLDRIEEAQRQVDAQDGNES